MKIGAVILLGGKSRRMGSPKSELLYEGQTFFHHISGELSGFDELLVSLDCPENHESCSPQAVADIFPNCGPLGGLHAALTACKSDALFAVSCDMPLFRRGLSDYLCGNLGEAFDAVVAVGSGGRIHPLCGVYRKSAAQVFEAQLKAGNYKLTAALDGLRLCLVKISEGGFSDDLLTNVNTPQEYEALLSAAKNP